LQHTFANLSVPNRAAAVAIAVGDTNHILPLSLQMDQETALTPIIWGLEETPLRASQALGVLKIGTGGVRTTTDYFFLKRNGWQNSPVG